MGCQHSKPQQENVQWDQCMQEYIQGNFKCTFVQYPHKNAKDLFAFWRCPCCLPASNWLGVHRCIQCKSFEYLASKTRRVHKLVSTQTYVYICGPIFTFVALSVLAVLRTKHSSMAKRDIEPIYVNFKQKYCPCCPM